MTNTTKDKMLNQKDREALSAFAKSHIECPTEKTALEVAYQTAKPYVLETVHTMFPLNDMLILKKYGVTREDKCVEFGGCYDYDSVFIFEDDDKDIPLVPSQRGCSDLRYEWSKPAKDALNAYVLATNAYNEALRRKQDDYNRLITGSRKFNDVVAVWPAAEQLRWKIVPETQQQRALAVLSEDAVARIRNDNAGAQVGV